MKKRICLVASCLLAAALTACGQQTVSNPPDGTPQSSVAESEPASAPVPPPEETSEAAEKPILYIGLSDSLNEVPCGGEQTAEALIASLSEETGWNLSLAAPVSDGPYRNSLSVAFASDSAIYSAPLHDGDEKYQVSDAGDLIYMVFNSTAETLKQNLSVDAVYFTAPDGGNIDFENNGQPFYLSANYPWYESGVRQSNEPLPSDSLGYAYFTPFRDTFAGEQELYIVFLRKGVQPGEGTITVYDENGTIYCQTDASNSEMVKVSDPATEILDEYNLKRGTDVMIKLDKPFAPKKSYTVTVDAGAFVYDEIKMRKWGKGVWEITCLDYGIVSGSPDNTVVKLGSSVTEEFFLGDSVDHIEIRLANPEDGTVSPTVLTEDGTYTFVPSKTGKPLVYAEFFLKNGSTQLTGITYDVIE